LRQLLDPSQYAQISSYIGVVIAITLVGWGIGGLLGGILADYIGRKRTMVLAIIAYSVATGLSAVAFGWGPFVVLRFVVAIAIGSEWATGSSMLSELWPNRARGRGAGIMQCGLGLGFFLAFFTWVFLGQTGPDAWRCMFALGVLPALLTLWLRRAIPESKIWQESNEKRCAALKQKRSGAALS
jgi:MFS family permease